MNVIYNIIQIYSTISIRRNILLFIIICYLPTGDSISPENFIAVLFFEAFKYAETAVKMASPAKSATKSLIEQYRPGTKY